MALAAALAIAVPAIAVPAIVSAQPSVTAPPEATPDLAIEDETPRPPDLVAVQEIGVRVGMELGGRTTPGGATIAGAYVYRVTDRLWFDSSIGFTFGSGDPECFRDRADDVVCDHDLLDGFAARASAGMRLFLSSNQGFVPYVAGGLGAGLIHFDQDGVTGVALPLVAGAGVRIRVADGVAVGGGAELRGGAAWLGDDIAWEPQLSLVLFAGVDFRL